MTAGCCGPALYWEVVDINRLQWTALICTTGNKDNALICTVFYLKHNTSIPHYTDKEIFIDITDTIDLQHVRCDGES